MATHQAIEIAGIGLLGIGLLLVVVRLLLPRLGKPEITPGRQFFETIDKIILFAFILGLVGVMTYAILLVNDLAADANEKANELKGKLVTLEVTDKVTLDKYEQLKRDHADLQSRVDAIEEPGLKSRSSALEVLSADITYDLTGWKLVNPTDLASNKVCEFTWTTRRTVWKAQKEATRFYATFGTTSQLPPDFSSSTHTLSVDLNKDPIPPGKESLKRWILTYDIGNEPLFQPFDIKTTIKAWNSFQNNELEHEGTLILYSTRKVSMTVIFPPLKHPKPNSIICFFYGLAVDKSKSPFPNPNLQSAPDGSRVTWEIAEPRLGIHYEIWWNW